MLISITTYNSCGSKDGSSALPNSGTRRRFRDTQVSIKKVISRLVKVHYLDITLLWQTSHSYSPLIIGQNVWTWYNSLVAITIDGYNDQKPICYSSTVISELLTLPYIGKKLMIIRIHAPWPVLLEECPVSSSCKHIHLGTVHWTGFYLTVCLYIPFYFFCRVYLHNVNKKVRQRQKCCTFRVLILLETITIVALTFTLFALAMA